MLLRVILKNFLSFGDAVQFDMFPNPKRTSEKEHIYTSYAVPVLKSAAIYGSNGAGKSNLVKGISFIRRFALDKDFLAGEDFGIYPFALSGNSMELPVEIALEFIAADGNGYIYSLAVNSKNVTEECLYKSRLGCGDNEPIFIRTATGVEFSSDITPDIHQLLERLIERNPMSSFMALNREFPVVSNESISKAYEWLKMSLVVIGTDSTIPMLIELMRLDGKLMDFTDSMMKHLCLGISNLEIETEDADEWLSKHAAEIPPQALDNLKENGILARMDNERQSLSIFMDHGIRKIGRFIFHQYGKDGYIGKMDISAQSDGTVRLLTLLPAIYNAVETEKTVVIDELDYKMHPLLVLGLIEYFSNNNKTRGQLIFTTHETSLLEEKQLLRYDEIWFADKKNGQTSLYSLNDFKFHHTMSVRNGYMDGRFGARPDIGNLLLISNGH